MGMFRRALCEVNIVRKIYAVILAAGNSTRFEGNKLLSEFHGKRLFEYTFEAVREAAGGTSDGQDTRQSVYQTAGTGDMPALTGVVVVTQYHEIASRAKAAGFDCVRNDSPEKGISHSIRLGVSRCQDADGVMFLVCDQPYLRGDTLQRMASLADGEHILRTSFGERKGSPALFPKRYFDELMELHGDVGGKAVMKKHPEWVRDVEVSEIRELYDVDTQGDAEIL